MEYLLLESTYESEKKAIDNILSDIEEQIISASQLCNTSTIYIFESKNRFVQKTVLDELNELGYMITTYPSKMEIGRKNEKGACQIEIDWSKN